MYNAKRIWTVEDKTLTPEEAAQRIRNGQLNLEQGFRAAAGERTLYLLNDSNAEEGSIIAVICVEPDAVKKSSEILGLQVESLQIDNELTEHQLLNEILESGNPDYNGMNEPVQFRVVSKRDKSPAKGVAASRRK